MNQFRIVADSSCDLLTLDGADFVSVPLSIRTDAEEFYDDANLDVDAMVSTLRDTKGRSYSACPNIADWESAFGESGNVIATVDGNYSGGETPESGGNGSISTDNSGKVTIDVSSDDGGGNYYWHSS